MTQCVRLPSADDLCGADDVCGAEDTAPIEDGAAAAVADVDDMLSDFDAMLAKVKHDQAKREQQRELQEQQATMLMNNDETEAALEEIRAATRVQGSRGSVKKPFQLQAGTVPDN